MDVSGSSPAPAPMRIVICPWLAFGHLLPCLELAERLASRGHRVSYVSTPRNLSRLPPAPRVDLVALPFPRVDGLPVGAESTNDVPADKRELLWKAFDGLAEPFAKFLAAACAGEDSRPHWIIADSFHHWAAAAAVQQKVPFAHLHPSAVIVDTFDAALAWPSIPHLQHHPFFNTHGASGMSPFQRCSLTLERCTLTAIRSCLEWEPECFQKVATRSVKPVVPLGLLPPSAEGEGGRPHASTSTDATVRWLDAHPPKTVVYVALGSEVPLAIEQVHELALGLELAGTRFLWALRKPPGAAEADILPPGFQQRTHDRGLVTMAWVPQMSILAHGAVGAFLTHCGWNSLIEGLLFGHPLIMLPIQGDQGRNADLMEGSKVGLKVARDGYDGSFDRHGVTDAVQAVMIEGEARRGFVENALKLQEIVADKDLHESYIDEFVKRLMSYSTGHN